MSDFVFDGGFSVIQKQNYDLHEEIFLVFDYRQLGYICHRTMNLSHLEDNAKTYDK